MMSQQIIEPLTELGLTNLEARIYVYLLQSSAATGYRVAKGIGATNASTYKALEALEAKGVVQVEEGERRWYRAVPYEELFDGMERRFRHRRRRAAEALRELAEPGGDDRVYHLKTVDQVYARARSMLASARRLVLADLFPEPFRGLRGALGETVSRGVGVAVEVYEPSELEGAELLVHAYASQALERWPVEWVALFVDGSQYLFAALERGGGRVHQAVWSASPILSWAYLSYAKSEFHLMALTTGLAAGLSAEELRAENERWHRVIDTEALPGLARLLEHLGKEE